MRLYRIGPEKYLNMLDGRGGSYESGGRWNRPGNPALYFGTSASVAMLEMGNYLPSPRTVPPSYRLGIYEFPDNTLHTWPLDQLPEGWADYPYPAATQDMGTAWLRQRNALIVLIPSSAVTGGLDNIAVVSPLHPKAIDIKLVDVASAVYNPRAFRGL